MSKMSDLHAAGVTDLNSYLIGRSDERDRLVLLLNTEQKVAQDSGDRATAEACKHLVQYLEAFSKEAAY